MATELLEFATPWAVGAAMAGAAVALAWLAHRLAFAALDRLTRNQSSPVGRSLADHARRPGFLVMMLFALVLALPAVGLPDPAHGHVERALSLMMTAAVGWLAFNLTRTINDVAAARYDITVADNLRAREIQTRLRLLQRILAVIVVLIAAAVLLMAIPGVRQIGITLFASAGIAGIVAGIAARPVLANLFAGLQLALTQPIRIDDVVIVEGEWGWIEEIRMTFVVVRVWDLRRLIVPLTYFIEKPFQNWTRQTAAILGTVYLHADYTVPVDRVQEELHRILQSAPQWDGKVWNLQVTGAGETTVELRALMGARNSGDAWDLRCHVRERLIAYLQREHPGALPRLRADLADERAGPPGTPADETGPTRDRQTLRRL